MTRLPALVAAGVGAGLGIAAASPAADPAPCVATLASAAPIVAGESATLTFRLEALGEGLAAGDTLEIRWPLSASFRPARWTEPQVQEPKAPGWVSVRGAARALVVPDRGEPLCRDIVVRLTDRLPPVLALVLDAPLYSGETIEVVYGPARAQFIPEAELRFRAHLRTGSGRREIPWRGEPLEVHRTRAHRVHLSGPSRIDPGSTAVFRVAALDSLGFAAAAAPSAVEVRAVHASGLAAGPFAATARGDDPSVVVTAPIELPERGAWWISASAAGLDPGWDVPVVVEASGPLRLAWGDLHWHTRDSDGSRSPEEGYRYARDVVGLDFASKTDHDVHYIFPCMDADAWERSVRLVRELEEPGRFAVLLGWEWTSGSGHRNVYFRDAEGSYLPEPEHPRPQDLWTALSPGRALTIPHHPAGGNVPRMDWRNDDPRFQRPVEIYSTHGNAEAPEGPLAPKAPSEAVAKPRKSTFQEALSLHREYTVLASTDNHTGTPGNPVRLFREDLDAGSGLCGAWVRNIDRESVFDALAEGRTYATTGPRILLELRGTEAGVEGRVLACAPISACELVGIPREGAPPFPVVATFEPDDRAVAVQWSRAADRDFGLRGVYLRVTQSDGEMAWSSPAFFEEPK